MYLWPTPSKGLRSCCSINCASVPAPYLIKLFFLCLSISTFSTCWQFAHIHPPYKKWCSKPSKYQPIAVISCVSKYRYFQSILNRKILKGLFFRSLQYDSQYGGCKWRSTGYRLDFLTSTFSSSRTDFGEPLDAGLGIPKAIDGVWQVFLRYPLESYNFSLYLYHKFRF